MAMLTWNPAWETGDEEIDRQHRTLLARIERLFQAIVVRQDPEEVHQSLCFLSEYVDEHFGAEEDLMERSHYPGMPGHKVIHADLRLRVAALIEAQAKDPGAVSDEVVDFLSDWLLSHIDGQDRALASHLRAHLPASVRVQTP